MFGMTSEYIEFRENDQLKMIEFESIEKMTYGYNPNPDCFHIVTKNDEWYLPKWILKEFDDILNKITERANLKKIKGPEVEESWIEKIKNYTYFSLTIVVIGTVIKLLPFGLILVLSLDFLCYGPIWAITVIGLGWMIIEMIKEPV